MPRNLNDLMLLVEQEARDEGEHAEGELAALHAHFGLVRELHELRVAKHLTQKELAAASGIGQSEISRIESGAVNPTVATVSALANSLGAEVHVVPRRL